MKFEHVCLISAGEIRKKGLVTPVVKEIYEPALDRLRKEGLTFTTTSTIQD